MDFFDRQEAARRKTGRLVALFALGVVAMIASLYLAAIVTLVGLAPDDLARNVVHDPNKLWNPDLLLIVAGGVLTVVFLGSVYKVAELSGGGSVVARELGGRLVDPNTRDPFERQLLNVVEEMAIASGVHVPPVYVLDQEDGINAFAAGFAPEAAVVAVSRGSIEYLTRDELQGVIGHEFSHILNGDMRLNLRLIGLLHGILLISLIGYYLMRMAGGGPTYVRQRSKDGEAKMESGTAFMLFGLAMLIIGWVGVFFGRLIKASVSRQREYLADASAVQFTRNPDGIAGALKKIGGLAQGSRMRTPAAETASHMFFGNGVPVFLQLLATHPPLEDRIKAIDPRFDGVFPEVEPLRFVSAEPARKLPPIGAGGAAVVSGLAASEAEAAPAGGADDPARLVEPVGQVTVDHVAQASRILASLPDELNRAVHEPYSARAVAFALLLHDDPSILSEQFGEVAAETDVATAELTRRIAPSVRSLGVAARLPLANMLLPALRELSPAQYDRFRQTVDRLASADHQTDLFEYALKRMLTRNLDRAFHPRPPAPVKYASLKGLDEPLARLLSALAYSGHDDAREAEQAFARGAAPLLPGATLRPREQATLGDVDKALVIFAQASPSVKRDVLKGAARVCAADEAVTVREAELFRAVADSLDCPVPPRLAEATRASA